MKKLVVLGAGGQIARCVIDMLGHNSQVEFTLYRLAQNGVAKESRREQTQCGC